MPLAERVLKSSWTGIQPYKGGKGRLEDTQLEIHKLSSNENPFGCSSAVQKAIADEVLRLNEYPDQTDEKLCKALSSFYNGALTESQFVTANGGVEIIEILVHAFLNEHSNCIVSNPCFFPYIQFSQKVGAEVIDIPLTRDEYRLDIDGIINAINDHTRIIWLCSPNNPTGTYIRKWELEKILAAVPDHVLVVFDEVYYQYADAEDYCRALPYVREGYNILGLNSFSKAYGLAGMRVGYAYTTEQIAQYINTAKRPFYVNRLALSGAIAALADQDFINDTVERTHEGRSYLYSELDKMNLKYWRTQGNFILIDPKMPSDKFEKIMAIRGVMIRPADAFGASDKVRVTIGTREGNDAFVESCQEVLKDWVDL